MDRYLDKLTLREKEVLRMRFGLDDGYARTLEEVGVRLKVTRERVRQIEASGIDAIRNSRSFKELAFAFDDLARHIEEQGAIIPEDALLSGLATDEKSRNRYRFCFRNRRCNRGGTVSPWLVYFSELL